MSAPADHRDRLAGRGEMADRIRDFDWGQTPLGPIATWPRSLRTTVELMLASRQPAYIAWGPALTSLYNDGYIPILASRHPAGLGQPFAELWSDIWEEYRPLVEATTAGDAQHFVDQPVTLGGRPGRPVSWFTFAWTPIHDESGAIAGFFSAATETTEKVRAEAALRDSAEAALREREERLRLALDVAELGTWTWDLTTGQGDLDDRGAEIVGLPVGHLADVPAAQLAAVHPDDLDRLLADIRAGIDRGEPFTLAYRVTYPDDTVHFVASRARVVHDAAGRPIRLVGTNRDVTAEREAEAALRESEERHRHIIASIDEGFCILQVLFDDQQRPTDYRYVQTNPVFEQQTGMQGVLGRTIRELVPNIEPFWADIYGTVALTGEPTRFVDHAPSMGRWFDVYAFRLGEPDERMVGVLFRDVTARRRAEEQLRASEERQAFVVRLEDGLRPLADPVEIQEVAARVLGEYLAASRVMYGEISGEGDDGFVVHRDYHRDPLPSVVGWHRLSDYGTAVAAQLRTGQSLVIGDMREVDALPPDALAAYEAAGMRAYAVVPLAKKGRIVAYLAVILDEPRAWTADEVALIHETADRTWAAVERARAEAALRESEARFRVMADAVPQIIWITDARGRAEFFNQQWTRYTGREYAPTTAAEIAATQIHPDDARLTMERFDAARQTGEPFVVEHRIRSATGEYRWFLVRGEPDRDPRTGAITRWFGTSIDIHDRKLAEDALRASEERFRTLIQQSADAVQLVRPDGVILYSSDSVETVLGYRPEEILGTAVQPYIHPDDQPAVLAWMSEVAAMPGAVASRQYRARHKNGTWAWLETTIANHLETPSINAIVGNFRNITARKLAEMEREALAEAAAHDLNTPLTSVRGQAQLLRRRVRRGQAVEPAALEAGLAAIEAAADRMTALVAEMMDAAYLSAGRPLELRLDSVDLAALARRTAEEAQRGTVRHRVRVTGDDAPLVGEWDATRLERVLANLLTNAIKFSPAGGEISLRLHCETAPDETAWAVASVTDQGVGIPPAELDRLFERYYRGTNVAGRIRGTGIGLAGAKQIVEQHGGTITVASIEGQGATFTLRLPLTPDAPPEHPAPNAAPEQYFAE